MEHDERLNTAWELLESQMGEGSPELIQALSLFVIARELDEIRLTLEGIANVFDFASSRDMAEGGANAIGVYDYSRMDSQP